MPESLARKLWRGATMQDDEDEVAVPNTAAPQPAEAEPVVAPPPGSAPLATDRPDDGLIYTKAGNPFKTKHIAENTAIVKRLPNYEIVPVEGGFAIAA